MDRPVWRYTSTSRMPRLEQRHALRCGDDANQRDAPGAAGLDRIDGRRRTPTGGEHGIDNQHVALADVRRQLRSVREAMAVASSRCNPMCPTRADGINWSTPSSMLRPARSTGTTTTSVRTTRPSAGPSGVVTVVTTVCSCRRASTARSRLIRVAARRNAGGVVRTSRQLHEGVVHQRMLDHVKGHG